MKALEILKNLRKAFGKHDKSLEYAIAELEALQEPKTCSSCDICGDCNIRKILINPSLNSYSVCLTEEAKLFGCNYHKPKGIQ